MKNTQGVKRIIYVMFKQLFMVSIKRNNIHYEARNIEFLLHECAI